jgi:hypothetical protein
VARPVKLPSSAHASRPWRIHALTTDFRVEDVWALKTPGGPDDFPRLVRQIASGEDGRPGSRESPGPRVLWAIRERAGALLGWDDPDSGVGARVPSLRERLPADLRDTDAGAPFMGGMFRPLYRLHDEWAAEIANRTVHAIMHLGWVPDGDGYRGEMAVLVKPNGPLGATYMAAIKPFRHWIIYPSFVREIERGWRAPSTTR